MAPEFNRNVAKERAVHSAEGVKGPKKPEQLGLTDGGLEVWEIVQNFGSEDESVREMTAKRLGSYLQGGLQGDGRCNGFGDLCRLVESFGGDRSAISGADVYLYDLWADVQDGLALAAIFRPGEKSELRKVVKKGDGMEVETYLGVEDGDKVLAGIGQAMIDTAITDKKLLRRLGMLQSGVENGRDLGEVYRGQHNAIARMMDNDECDYGQAMMVLSYLDSLIGAGVRRSGVDGEPIVPPDRITRDGFRKERFGAPEGMSRVQVNLMEHLGIGKLEELKSMKGVQLEAWIVDQVVEMVENPLFFANWWQGTASESLVNVVRQTTGMDRREAGRMRDFTRAVCAVFGMGEADRNVDDTAVTLVQFNPPKNMAKEMMWSKEKFDLLQKHPAVGFLMREVFDVAFEKGDYEGQGWRITDAFSSEENRSSEDVFCSWMLNKLSDDEIWQDVCKKCGLEGNQKGMHGFARLALEQFEVDYMPEWIRWAHKNKLASPADRERQLDWFKYKPSNLGEIASIWDASMTAIDDRGNEISIPYNHPRVMRPADLLLIKGSFLDNPSLVANFHRVMDAMIGRRFYDKEGRMKPCRGSSQLDKYKKFAGFLEAVGGKGVQGQDIDDLTTFGDAIRLAVNYWGGSDHEALRDILADLFAVKVDAIFWKGYQSGAIGVLLNLMRLDPTFSDERERKAAIETISGGQLRANYGIFADAKRLWNMDFFGEEGSDIARNALVRLIMDEPDVEKAWKAYGKGKAVLVTKLVTTVADTVGALTK